MRREHIVSWAFRSRKAQAERQDCRAENPHYWDRARIKLAGIKIAIVGGLTQLHMFEKNELVDRKAAFSHHSMLFRSEKRGDLTFYPF
jgi:ABC-type oligopeptide transport system substrate-binding subunit